MTDLRATPLIDSEYMVAVDVTPPRRKTRVIEVRSRSTGAHLGTLKWYGAWRQYVFYPQPHTIFNVGCMRDLMVAIETLMIERQHKVEARG